MNEIFVMDFFESLRYNDVNSFRKLHSQVRSVAPLSSGVIANYSHFSDEQIADLRVIFTSVGIPEEMLASPEEVEEAYRIFYAVYVHTAPR